LSGHQQTQLDTVELPALGAAVPRSGGRFSMGIGRLVMRLLGWKFCGGLPNLPKFVIIGAPHTSNWDGIVSLAAKLAIGLDARFLAKHTLFHGPSGWLLARLGGIPIRRDSPGDIAIQAAKWFEENNQMVVGITPEGTRKKGARWKTGFHRIALAANVPIVCVMFDYAHKQIGPGLIITPTADLEADLAVIQGFYRTIRGKHPR
jgi:1-acyl-sn-glycerol-3-phosphate acyltransferase